MSTEGELEMGEVRMTPHNNKKAGEEVPDGDGGGYSIYQNVYFAAVWIIVAVVMIFFITRIASQLEESYSSPSTVIMYQTVSEFALPQTTICNWNQMSVTGESCPYCAIELISCTDQARHTDCGLAPITIASPGHGIFNCFQYNTNPDNILQAKNYGYDGSFSALFRIVNPPEDDLLRVGLQVSFNEVGKTPDLYSEDKFAPPGFDSYFAIQSIKTKFENDSSRPDDLRYEATYSPTIITRKGNETHSYVSVSWAFQTLNVQQIVYTPQYTIDNFFGDFAGMIGTLMGLDVIKLASGIYVAIRAWKGRSIIPLQEHFNG